MRISCGEKVRWQRIDQQRKTNERNMIKKEENRKEKIGQLKKQN